ncbi:MAG: hypothetical protein CMJ83_05030 [Planctomycetes bacterium]|nr:hypothetical protein [Planctomycetota bacterium]
MSGLESLLAPLADLTWQASIVLLAAGLLAFALSGRSAALRCSMRTAALCALPVLVASYGLVPRMGWYGDEAGHTGSTLAMFDRADAEGGEAERAGAGGSPAAAPSRDAAPVIPAPATPARVANPVPSTQTPSWRTWMVAIWIAGVAFFSLRLTVGAWRIRRLVSNARPWTGTPDLDPERLARGLGIAPVAIVTSPDVNSPFVAGGLRPVIVLPATLSRRLPAELLEPLLLHELVHVARKDGLVNRLSLTLRTLLWHDPLMWMMHRGLAVDREIATDGEVVRTQEGRRSSYARGLLAVLRSRSGTESALAVGARGPAVRRRVELLLGESAPGWRPAGRAAGVIAILFAVAVLPLATTSCVFSQEKPPAASGGSNPKASKPGSAVDRALAALARLQRTNGSWAADDGGDVASTSLSMLAFLGAGNTPQSGPHKRVLDRAATWLIAQSETQKRLGRGLPPAALPDFPLATLTLCELAAMTRNQTYAGPAQAAVASLLEDQHEAGGWGIRTAVKLPNTYTTAWAVMALKSARVGKIGDSEQIDAALERALGFVDSLTDGSTGRTGFTSRGQSPVRPAGLLERFPPARTEDETAAAILTRVFCGEKPKDSAVIKAGAALLAAKTPKWERGSVNNVYWMFGGLSCYQVGGGSWRAWGKALKSNIAAHQVTAGAAKGTWELAGPWTRASGAASTTAINALCLETYYRYARVFGVK